MPFEIVGFVKDKFGFVDNHVSFDEAYDFCHKAGLRLPTIKELHMYKAARLLGPGRIDTKCDKKRYPYDQFFCNAYGEVPNHNLYSWYNLDLEDHQDLYTFTDFPSGVKPRYMKHRLWTSSVKNQLAKRVAWVSLTGGAHGLAVWTFEDRNFQPTKRYYKVRAVCVRDLK